MHCTSCCGEQAHPLGETSRMRSVCFGKSCGQSRRGQRRTARCASAAAWPSRCSAGAHACSWAPCPAWAGARMSCPAVAVPWLPRRSLHSTTQRLTNPPQPEIHHQESFLTSSSTYMACIQPIPGLLYKAHLTVISQLLVGSTMSALG